ncbi:MAG: hypothetical protein ACRDJ9_14410 [Dehalococcoidia bacterium]
MQATLRQAAVRQGWNVAEWVTRHPLAIGVPVMLVLLVAIYTQSAGLRASRGASITGDEPFYLLTTRSLLDDRNLDLRAQYELRSYTAFFDHPDGLWMQSLPMEDGRLLSPHNPGLSVLLIPGFAWGGLAGVQAQLLLTAALTFALTYVLVAKLTGAPLASWLATLAVALTATAFIYATEVYPELPAALVLVGALLLVTGDARLGVGRALALVVLLSAMAWLGIKYAPLIGLVGGYALVRAENRGRVVLAVAGAAWAGLYVWFQLRTFGALTPYSVNVVWAGDSTVAVVEAHVNVVDRIYRLWGLFIDRRFGVARWAPILFLALAGCIPLLRQRGLPRLILALIAAQLLIATFVAITMVGWWFPGRTLVTVLPLFALPLAVLLRDGRPWLRLTAAGLGAYSALITLHLARAGHAGELTIAVDPFRLQALPFQRLSWLFPQYTAWGADTWLLTAAWLAAGAVMFALLWQRRGGREQGIGNREQ